ncbi:YwiC-like family protein [Evansella sp. AB-P1]|uniref:YwiC-like family protein n=1 Tax=Evansella sp. AB-P1 TaxID=3037653 RepID=UPI00241FA57F|nr:YwiC-like family protein [Evansella sp. AB-P1]MDG5789158.1 YwiC-like family protein [Evansella sp. AB-P1]
MKWYIPREHGAWAMLIIPYWIGAAISGIEIVHVIFFIGLFSIYFAQAPLLTYIRNSKKTDVWPSFFTYVAIGALFTIPIMIVKPVIFFICIAIFPLFMINLIFAKLKKERWFINDVVAILALSSLLIISYRLTEQAIEWEAYLYLVINAVFFIGSVFHVKSLIREKNNKPFRFTSILYHFITVVLAFTFNFIGVAIAYFTSLLKTLFVPKKYLEKPVQIGVVEIINSAIFFIFVVIGYFFW